MTALKCSRHPSEKKLSPKRMMKIKDASLETYPLSHNETEKKAWSKCVKAMDACNRTLIR